MSRAFSIMSLLATAIAVFIIASGSPGPAWAATSQQCYQATSFCYKQCKGTVNEDHCRDGCVDNLLTPCLLNAPKDKKSGIDPGDTGGTPPKKWQPPVNVGVNPPEVNGGSKPPKHPIGFNPVAPINPVKVEQPGSGSGSGVTILEKSGTEKKVTTSPSGLTTIKDKNWGSTAGSSGSGQGNPHGRHR
jgi:hypothetical protein